MNQLIHQPTKPSRLESQLIEQLWELQPLREQQLIELVEINSSSLNPEGINRTGEYLEALFTPLSDRCERITLSPWERLDFDGRLLKQPLGDLWRYRCRTEAPIQILLCGHLDTVFPKNSPFQCISRITPTCLNGPGAADMKGGILVILSALSLLEKHPEHHKIGWTLLLNPDEEIGSPGSAPLLQKEAVKHHIGLVYEPTLPDQNLAGARKGSGNFTCAVHGRAAHAGREPEKGRNAINKAAEILLDLAQFNHLRPGLTLNTGMIQGGETTNKVPDLAVFKFNIRIAQPEDAQWCQQKLNHLIKAANQQDGYNVTLHGGFGRLPKQLDPVHLSLYQYLQQCALHLGRKVHWQATGGCCDGNNLSAAGLPNIDTLGVHGNFIHSADEIIELPSLTQQAQLSALLLFKIAQQGLPTGISQRESREARR
ncbi:hydrolase [uncultured Neptuniibacter sp.]|uniref:hydrolase n=1 Tax=uncultured Neptuniibacter sp. TaxID=502143 RepID=UPI00262A6D71|nr:hydrolase [uncultured Neptuniibacter sp.]